MQSFLLDIYPWLKSLHVISMVAWMAGLFYLPRLFVYHVEVATTGSEMSETFKIMERRLYRAIMNPAMISTWIFGILMIVANGWGWLVGSPWMLAKLICIGAMTWFHHWCGKRRKDFERDGNEATGRHFRLMNEVPTLLLIAIVILVIVQPF